MADRLLKSSPLAIDESGKVKNYIAVWNKDETILEETQSIMERVYRGDLLLLVSNAVKEQKMTKEEIEELKNMLDSMEE